MQSIFRSVCLTLIFSSVLPAQSRPTLPHGGAFSSGSGSIALPSGGTLDISQSSARGIIDWSSFSIGAGGRVLLNNGSGVTLNRVLGGDLSRIDGLLKATGSVYLINPNGVIIGEHGCVIADGTFLASTRNIASQTFMSGGGLTASGSSSGIVSNAGVILARQGNVILIGRSVDNPGVIQAPKGRASLAAGDSVLLNDLNGPVGLFVAPVAGDRGNVTTTGRIAAAAAALQTGGGDIYTLAGNRSGLISATGTETINGQVWLSAPGGNIVAAGAISAHNSDGLAGSIRIGTGDGLAQSTQIAANTSLLTGDGGSIETSGHSVSIGHAHISAGRGGSWLVDPIDLTIDAAAASTISATLNSGSNVTEQTTATTASGSGTQSAGNGDINVAAPLTWTGSGALTLSAYHDLNLNAAISGAGAFSGSAGNAVSVNAAVAASNVQLTASSGNLNLGATIAGTNGVTLATGGNFLNTAGSNALSSASGRWLVYSSNPGSDATGGLSPDFLQYTAPAGATPAANGNGLLYSTSPSLTVALSGTVEKTYDGSTAATFSNANSTVSGLINSDSADVTGSYAGKNAASNIKVTASNITVTHAGIPVYGYSGTAPSVTAPIGQIDPATLTASIAGNPTKTYNGTTTAELTSANYQLTGFATGEGATVNQPSSVAYDAADAGTRTISATFSPTNFVPNSGTSLSNYVLPASAAGPGYINQAPLLISGVLAIDKAYDRTTAASLNAGAATLYGIIGADNVSLVSSGASGTFSSPNAGTNLAVTASGFTLAGSKAADYALAQPSGLTASINPASLFISGVSALDKVYDATTTALLNTSGASLNGAIAGDTLTLGTASASGSFASADAGSAIAVAASGFTFSGTASANYRLAQPAGLFANITPKTVTVALNSAPTKTYNGDPGAIIGTSGFSLSGFVTGQSATIGQTSAASYASPNAGTQTVTATLAVSDYTAGPGTKLSNYTLPASVTGTGVIEPAPISLSLTGNPTKTYDGTVAAVLDSTNFLLSGFLAGQSATVKQTAGSYDSPNVGLRQVTVNLSLSDFSPGSGTLLSNYTFPSAVTGSGTILPAPVSAGSISAAISGNPTKFYDGTTIATLSSSDFTLSGFIGNQGATVTQTMGTYGNKNVGVQAVTASLTPSDFTPNSGTDLSNYTLPNAAYGSGTINPAVLTAVIAGTPTKVYNGTTRATLPGSSFTISGLASGENITIGDAVHAIYDSSQAGSRTVTAAIATTDITPQANTLLSNYVLPSSATGPGSITQAPLSILGVAAQNKTYDTTTTAALSTGGAHLFGVVGSDSVSLSASSSSAVFATPNAGSNIPVTASGFSISGTDSANYQLVQPTGLAATINRAPLSISGVTAADKNYDATLAATLNTGSAALAGLLSADNGQVSLDTSGNFASFHSVNVGNNLAVSTGGFALSGTQAANYALSQPSGLTANINPQPLVATIIGDPTKVYDGSPSTTLHASNYSLSGFVAGQGASVPQSASVQYSSPNAGLEPIQSTLVSSDFVANAGTNLSNYSLPVNGNGTGHITQAPLSAAIIGNPTRTYDSTTAATLNAGNYALTGFIPGQSATVSQTSGTYDLADAGPRSVTAALATGDFTAGGGTNLSNYSLPTSATGPGAITKAQLQVINVAGTDRVYNGLFNDTLNVASANVFGLLGSDSVTLNTAGASGVFASKDAGTNISVTGTGFSISGGQSADYTLLQPTGLTANITAAMLSLGNITRVYDSLTDLPTASSAYTLNGVVSGDNVSVNTGGLSGSYSDKNVSTGKNVTLSGLALSGAQAGDYMIASTLTNVPIGTITKAPLTVSGAMAIDKIYDATTAATLDNTSAALGGLFSGDNVTLDSSSAIALFNNKNVGSNKPVTASGYTVSGTDLGNYSFTQPATLAASITPFTGISLGSVTKTYDGGVALPVSNTAYTLNGVLASDSVQVAAAGLSGSYATSNVGNPLNVSVSGLALTGTDAANYAILPSVSNEPIGIINPKALTAALVGNPTKTYDTTNVATLSAGNYSVSGFVAGQGATVSKTSGIYASPNANASVGVSTTLAAGDFTAAGATQLTNYILPVMASGTGRINQAPLTINGVLATDKVYTGTTADTLDTASTALSGVLGSDAVTLNKAGASANFASPNVGTGIGVTAAGFTIGGAQAANYTLAQPTGLSASITQAVLNLASVNKVYDATAAATGAGVSYTLSGIQGSDAVSLNVAGLAGTYAAKNAGGGLDVSLTGLSLTGAKAANYSIASSVSNDPIGTITKAPLSVIGALASNKVYDGTNAASLDNSSAGLSGILGSDAVTLSAPSNGTFASPNVGAWAVTAGGVYSISGTDAGNYNLSQPSGFAASITPAPLTAAITGNPTRTYNASTASLLNPANYSLTGFVTGQGASITQTSGVYDAPDAGSRTVTAVLSGANFTPNGGTLLSNYMLPTTASGAGFINTKALSAALVGTPTKTYDSTTASLLSAANFSLIGFVAGQSASVTQTSGLYNAPDAGSRTVTALLSANDFTPGSGTSLSNYSLPSSASGSGLINTKTLTAVISGNPAKIYDATAAATLAPTDYTLSGFVTGQSASINQAAGVYDSANAGARSVSAVLNAADFTAGSGTLLSNYALPASATGAGLINQKSLSAAISGTPTKTYDATNAATLAATDYTLSGFVAGQSATITQSAGSYASPDAGVQTVSTTLGGTNFSPGSGTNLSNYLLPTSASGTGVINAKALTAAISDTPTKSYDGSTIATLAPSDYTLSGFVAGQNAIVTQTAGTYAGSDAGSWGVTASLSVGNFSPIGGTSLSNYTLPSAAAGTGLIDPKVLSAAIVNASKTYDGSNAAAFAPANFALTGFAPGQGAVVNQSSGVYATSDAGSQTVTAALPALDFALTGGAVASNYILPTSASGVGLISPKALSAVISGTPVKTYDGTNGAVLASSDYTLSGFIAGQNASINQTSGAYASSDAGTRAVTAALANGNFDAATGTNLANYLLPTSAAGSGVINQKQLAAAIIGDPSKTYDSSNAARLASSNYALTGFVANQSASINQTSGLYDNADAGTRSISATLAASSFTAANGTNLSNYLLPTFAAGSGVINQKQLSAAIIGDPAKTYDSSNAATLSSSNYSLSGFVANQAASINQTSGFYDSANAGTRSVSATLAASNFTAANGTDLANYLLPSTAEGSGRINQKQLTAILIGDPAKIYDSSNAAALASSNYALSGFVANQSASINQTSGLYDKADAGTRSVSASLAASNFTAANNTNLANYLLPTSASGTGTINPKQLSAVLIGDPTKMSDGTTTAVLTPANFALTGFLPGQGAVISQARGAYDSPDAGTRLVTALLNAQDISFSPGTLASNYLWPSTATGAGLITPAIQINAPSLAAAISSNLLLRHLAPAAWITTSTAQTVYALAVPRAYIPYPSPSLLSTWQNNGFGSLPTILSAPDRAFSTGAALINSTEQILLQGGREKSWRVVLPNR